MKFPGSLLGYIVIFFTLFIFSQKAYTGEDGQGYKNIYGIAWSGKPDEDIKYAKQMGYDYIVINPSSRVEDYHNNPECAGLKFYLIDPQWYPHILSGHARNIDTTGPVSDAAKSFYNQRMVWKSNDPFPENLATGYHTSTGFSVLWDFQQQAVIDEVVEGIISLAKSYEDPDLSFTFGGYIVDEPKLAGEFYRLDENGNNMSVGLSWWTGVDSGLVHGTITHEYATYPEGMAAFYRKLRARMAEEFASSRWVVQPTLLYNEADNNEWIYQIKDRADRDELTPDMLSQKSRQNTNYVDDANNFNSGVRVTRDMVGSSQASEVDEYQNRLFAARAGINGAWYNWFGRFGDMPDFQGITEVYPRLKLIRCLPNWDNLNNVPLGERSWDGSVYQSTGSYAGRDVIYSRHPKTGKLFAVFLTADGVIRLNAGETVSEVQHTNGFFIESGDGSGDVTITGTEIGLKSGDNIDRGYIFTISTSTSSTATVSETKVTSSSVETNVAGANGLSQMARYEYWATGVSSDSRSSTQGTRGLNQTGGTAQYAVSAQTWQQVPIRTAAQKTAGLSGGEGMQDIYALSYAPSNANVVYLLNDTAQVWKSIDGGSTWQRKHKGFRANGGVSLVVDPKNENIVFVAACQMGTAVSTSGVIEGIYRTKNGGDSWELVKSTPVRFGDYGGSLFAFGGSNTVYAGTYQEGLLKSTDGGDTWNTIALSGKRIADVKIHPQNPSILFVSCATDNKLYKITDSGSVTVTPIGLGLPRYPFATVVNPGNPSILYAATGVSGVYKSVDGGLNFNAKNNGLSASLSTGREARYLAISTVDPNYLYVSFTMTHFYYTQDGGENWYVPGSMDEKNVDGWVCGSQFGTDNPSSGAWHSGPIAVHPADKSIALMTGAGYHVKKTVDGGRNWRYSSTGYTGGRAGNPSYSSANTPISWDPNDPNRAVFFLIDYGPFLTTDGGSTFKNLNVPRIGAQTTKAGALDPTPNSQVIVTSVGKNKGNTTIVVTKDGGATWKSFTGTDIDDYRFFAFHPAKTNIIYAGWFKSTDKGSTFTKVSRKIIAMYPKNGDIVYSTEVSGSNTIIFKSVDGGITWTSPYPAIPGTTSVGQITIDPNNQDKIYVAVSGKGIYIINGSSLSLKNEANGLDKGWFSLLAMRHIAVDPKNTDVLYAGSISTNIGQSNGIFRSTDGGNTWTNITYNLGPEFSPWSISVNPHDGYVYVGSSHGTWKLPPPYATTTVDTTAPNCTISINNGDTYTNSTTVTLNLSATDDTGVTGYYLSADSTTPLASSSGWTSVPTTTNYNGSDSYTLSSGDGTKVVYVWYKDAAGNVSSAASDSITLNTTINDTTPTTITITSPTSGDAYTTNQNTINLSGIASDDTGISTVTWSNNRGGSGTVLGTTNWSITGINLLSGENIITVTAKSNAGSTGILKTNTSSRYFTDGSGKAVYLTGSHTWNNFKDIGSIDPPPAFDYNGYLDFLQRYNHNFIRLWTWELAKYTYKTDGSFKYSTPFPWSRKGPGTALDGNPKFDLNSLDQSYFDRLRSKVIAAGDKGIYVSIMLFEAHGIQYSNAPWRWDGHPFNIENNINGVDGDPNKDGKGLESHTLQIPEIVKLQEDYVKKVVDTVNDLDNVLYEISNEDHAGSIDWQYYMINFIRNYEKTKPKQHPIGMTADRGLNSYVFNSSAEWVSPSGSGTSVENDPYKINPPATDGSKVVILDTDHLWGTGGDRIWVWKSFLRGYNPIYMDDLASDTTKEGARKAMGHTLTYARKMNLKNMSPRNDLSSTTYCLANPGLEYLAYQPTSNASFTVNLVAGTYNYEWFNPGSGTVVSKGSFTTSDGNKSFTPPFSGDAVLYIVSGANLNTINDVSNVGTDTIIVNYNVDITPPNCTITINNGATYTNTNTVTLTLSATDDIGVTGYYLSANSKTPSVSDAGWVSVTSTINYTENISYTLSSGDGNKTLSVWYRDGAGNLSGIASDSITLDTAVPSITIASPTANSTFIITGSTISLGGSASDSTSGISSVTWSNDKGGIGTASGTNSWTISDISLSSGDNVITVVANDGAGNVNTDTVIVTYYGDTTPPHCTIAINNDAAYTNSTAVTLTLSATDDIGVTGYYLSANSNTPSVSDAGWVSVTSIANYTENISYTLSSGDGSKTLYVWYKDAAGNVSAVASDSITFDTIAPAITITSPTSSLTYTTTSSTISLGGSASDSTSGVNSVTWSNDKGGSGTASGTVSWTISDISLSSGGNVIIVTANDGAGNTSKVSITVNASGSSANDGKQVHYTFDDGNGTTTFDSSGNGSDGKINGATWTTGKNGGGLSFDGVDDYVSVPRMNYDEISISAWFYKNANDTSNADAIFGGWRWNSDTQLQEGFDLRFFKSAPDTLQFNLVTRNASGIRTRNQATYNFSNSIGSWHHVVGAYNQSTGEQKLYVDGQLVNTQTHPAGNTIVPMTYYPDMRIGYSRVNNGYFKGIIDDVRLYNRPLSDPEVLDLYNGK